MVLGHDQGAHADLLDSLAKAPEAEGLSVGICDDSSWRLLCGQTNIQSSTIGDRVFIHIELDESVRANDQGLLNALERSFTPPAESYPACVLRYNKR